MREYKLEEEKSFNYITVVRSYVCWRIEVSTVVEETITGVIQDGQL